MKDKITELREKLDEWSIALRRAYNICEDVEVDASLSELKGISEGLRIAANQISEFLEYSSESGEKK